MTNTMSAETKQILKMAHYWVLKLKEPNVTQSTRDAFAEWLSANQKHKDIYRHAASFESAFDTLDEGEFDEDMRKESLSERLTTLTDRLSSAFVQKPMRFAIGTLTLAFVFTAIISLTDFRIISDAEKFELTQSFQTDINEILKFTLDDGSVMTLGAASKAEARFSDIKRTVALIEGSLFVDIQKDVSKPFSVTSGDLNVTALGTSFDVQRFPSGFIISVAEGKVDVAYKQKMHNAPIYKVDNQELNAGQTISASTAEGLESVANIATTEIGAWRNGELIYRGNTLFDIFADANRYSKLPIEIASGSEQIGELELQGIFQGNDIDKLLSIIALTHAVVIDRSDEKKIVVRKKISP